jgi:putative transposase
MICDTVEDLTPIIGTRPACRALGAAPATIYRRRRLPEPRPRRPRPTPARALSEQEREQVLEVLHSERFVDSSPAQVWATLLDEGTYLASERTIYRLLASHHGGVRERRDQLTHPGYARPELLAERPNELWSWDITKLKGPAKWTAFYLYVILDVFSRYAVGWTVQYRETGQLAKALITQSVEQQQITPAQLTVHADRGIPMRSKPVAFLMADLGVTKSHSRPYTSTDNPYSEAQFKTLKYRPEFPERFDSIEQAREFCRGFLSLEQPRTSPLRDRLDDPRLPSTTGERSSYTPRAPASSKPPTRAIPSGSSARRPSHPRCRPPRGSTSPTQGRSLTKNDH